jgi:methylmalonyl-CoA mutase N-terminal domain/subunit
MLAAIAQGRVQGEIQEASYRYQREVEQGRRRVVGVNCYQEEEKSSKRPLLKVSPKLEELQKRRLAQFKKNRGALPGALGELACAARDSQENLFPHILSCVETSATLGEICDTLRGVFGEHHGS